ncbi:MAG TPA: TIR domain-containing protein [Caulobacteraceae bacterium]
MSDAFISYARSTARHAEIVAEALRMLGYSVWRDDDLPSHRAYADVIEDQLRSAKAVVVIWSADAVKSQWVRSEANRAREADKLVQLSVDQSTLPMPFDQIQCADLTGWSGDLEAPGWRKVVASIADLIGQPGAAASPAAASSALPSKASIAVLPFSDMTGSEGQDYFADGMVVEIVEALSRIRSIFVIASGSSLSFKGKGVSPREAARELGVRYVLEGSIRQAGGRVRIGVQLIDASDGAQIWTHRFEDTLEDVFVLQDKVALAVAGKIEPTVLDAEVRRASARPTENMGSYDLYLRALALSRSLDRTETLQALDLLKRAISLDPGFGLALSAAGSCCYFIDIFGWCDHPEQNRREAIEMVHRSVKAAGDDADVLATASRSAIHFEHDLAGAVALVEKAIALNPGCARAWQTSGLVRTRAGDTDLAVEHFETAMRLDPMGPSRPRQLLLMGVARFQQGRFSDVIALMKEATQQTDSPTAYAFLAASYGHLGETHAALEALARYQIFSPLPVEVFGRSLLSNNPSHISLFVDGIGLAQGKEPPDQATSR